MKYFTPTPEYTTALIRATLTMVVTAIATGIAAWLVDATFLEAVIIAAVPFVSILAARYAVEGTIDSRRNHGRSSIQEAPGVDDDDPRDT